MSGSRAVRFIRNAGFNILGQSLLALLSFALIPPIIAGLKPEGYALWGLMGTLSGYLALLTLGAGAGTQKFVSELAASRRRAELETVLGLALWAPTALVALGSLAALASVGFLVERVFAIGPDLAPRAMALFRCAILAAAFVSLAQYAVSALQGLQRFDLANIVSGGQAGLLLAGAFALTRYGEGLGALGWFFLAAQALAGLGGLSLALGVMPARPAWRLWPGLGRDTGGRWARFSLAAFVGQLSWSVVFQCDRIFIGHWLSLAELAYYMIPAFLLQKFFVIPATISSVSFPMFSELHGLKDHGAMRIMYRKCSRLLLWAVLPAFAFLFTAAPQFLTLWLGEEFSTRGVWPLRVLSGGYLVYFMALIAGAAYAGSGRVRAGLVTNSLLALVCLLLWALLVPRLGIIGAAWGFSLAYLLAYGPFIRHVNKEVFAMSSWDYLRDVCWGPCAAAGLMAAAVWSLRFQLYSWPAMLLAGGASTALYYGAGYRLLDAESRETLDHLVERLRGRLEG